MGTMHIFITISALLISFAANATRVRPSYYGQTTQLAETLVDQTHFDSESNLHSPYLHPDSFRTVMKDAENRVDPTFRIPKGLENHVEFWMKIYTLYSSRQVVIYDRNHPTAVYEVLDFRPLKARARNYISYAILRERRIEAKELAYQQAFETLKTKKKGPWTFEETQIRRIRQDVACTKHKTMHTLVKNIRFQTGQRDFIIKGLKKADRYFPVMEKIFRRQGLPIELTRLPLLESSFNHRAISKADARGVWQFMENPGYKFLKIDQENKVDERLSPIKATVAAATLLKQNRKLLGNWFLALTAYHSGFYGIIQIPKRLRQIDRLANFLTDCEASVPLGIAGKNYYSEYLAILYAETYRDQFYGHHHPKIHAKIEYIQVNEETTALDFSIKNSISYFDFRELNPDIQSMGHILPSGIWIARKGDTENIEGIL